MIGIKICFFIHIVFIITNCASYKILAVFPYNGRSHHIYYSSFIEELASRKHDVTVVNYFPLKKMPNLHQISLQNVDRKSDTVDIEDHLKSIPSNNFLVDFFKAYDTVKALTYLANSNCEKLLANKDVQRIVNDEKFDLVIIEQFVTDCGFAVAHELNAPTVGMTAHVLMPWTYSRLGAPNNPSFVANHFFGSGTRPDLFNRIKSAIINTFLNLYYRFVTQRNDYEIVKKFYPDTPDLEGLGRNMSLIMLNQYFPLTGSRLHGANVIEVGGLHIKQNNDLADEELEKFLDNSESGVVYISFGSVASNFPRNTLEEIIKVLKSSKMTFVWKLDNVSNLEIPRNTFLRKWLPQPAILCHPKVVAFITHSGMLSSSETMHCGVPVVSVPLFGDQFANAKSAVENGLGVTVAAATLNKKILEEAIDTVLQERYQSRAKQLSKLWRDRPMSAVDTAIYWTEYVARHKNVIDLKPPTVDLPLYQYLMLDVFLILGLLTVFIVYATLYILASISRILFRKQNTSKHDKKKKNT